MFVCFFFFRKNVIPPSWTLILPESWNEFKMAAAINVPLAPDLWACVKKHLQATGSPPSEHLALLYLNAWNRLSDYEFKVATQNRSWALPHVPVFVWKRRNWTTVYTYPVKTLTKIAKMRHFKTALQSGDFWKGRFNAVLVWMDENAALSNFNWLTITSRCWIPICAHAPIKDGIRLLHFRLQPFLVDNITCRGGLKKNGGK